MLSITLPKLKSKDFPKYIAIALFGLSLILPGFGYIYISNVELLLNLKTQTLILLSIFHSLPIFLIWLFESLINHEKRKIPDVVLNASLKAIGYFYIFALSYHFIAALGLDTINSKPIYLLYGIMLIAFFLDCIDSRVIWKK